MKDIRIAFFDTKPYDREFFEQHNQAYGFKIKFLNNRLNEDTVDLVRDYNVVCAFVNDQLSKRVLDALHSVGVKLVALRCAGYNNVDLDAAYKRVHVVRVPAYSPHAVAEHALALMMALNRKTHRAYYRTRDNNFAIHGFLGFDMHGKTAGVVGTGKIGRLVCEILKGLGMRVLAYDLYPQEEWGEKIGVEYVELKKLFQASDVVTLHCPLTAANLHMINEKTIAEMKDGVMIVNTGRGGLIDSAALLDGLKSHKIGSAGLDVYEEEDQYFFEDFSSEGLADDVLARLLTFPNVLITAHQAFFTKEAMDNIATTTLDNIRAFSKNEPLENEICYRCSEEGCRKQREGRCFKL